MPSVLHPGAQFFSCAAPTHSDPRHWSSEARILACGSTKRSPGQASEPWCLAGPTSHRHGLTTYEKGVQPSPLLHHEFRTNENAPVTKPEEAPTESTPSPLQVQKSTTSTANRNASKTTIVATIPEQSGPVAPSHCPVGSRDAKASWFFGSTNSANSLKDHSFFHTTANVKETKIHRA